MAIERIVEKINHLIESEDAFSSEKDAMYLLIQLRKLMEQDKVSKFYASVTFYCDWVAHTEKNQKHASIEEVYRQIYQGCKDYYVKDTPSNDHVYRSMQFENLRNDMAHVFDHYEIEQRLLDDYSLWIRFSRHLLSILADQPIVEIPGDDIDKIEISEKPDRTYYLTITFTKPIIDSHGRSHRDFKAGLGYMFANDKATSHK